MFFCLKKSAISMIISNSSGRINTKETGFFIYIKGCDAIFLSKNPVSASTKVRYNR